MSEYSGANNSNTMGANLKEVYPKDKKKFKKIKQMFDK